MALKGTLKDFGIGDILQLIGQQTKTGVLFLKTKDQEVQIGFKDGNIVKSESSTRKKKDLIGTMLMRAELITEAQLVQALETQKRTLKRLGDVLVGSKVISHERFREMVNLQAQETLYRLFGWRTGTYEFEQKDVEIDEDAMRPLRAESVLMEGFRMVDEWPVIKKVITSYEMTFEHLKPLPVPAVQEEALPQPANDAFDDALDDAFAEEKREEKKGDFKSVGSSERRVHGLITPKRDVRRLIELSCLGEFETCKALLNLVNLGYLKANSPAGKKSELAVVQSGALERVISFAGRVVVTLLVIAGLAVVATRLNLSSVDLSARRATSYSDPAAQRFLSRAQISRIEAALTVFRLENGKLPEQLAELRDSGLLEDGDLRYPWRDGYYYRRTSEAAFVLLPPLR